MSKPQLPLKRPHTITAWLKKENVKEEDSDDTKAKILKQSVRIHLKPLDNKIISTTRVVTDPEQIVDQVKVTVQEKRATEPKSNEQQPKQGLRRSARNLPPGDKPVEKPIKREPDVDSLPPILFKGRINYVHEFHDCANVCDKLLTEVENSPDSIVPVGFDLEWPFSFQTGPGKTALAQICLNEKICHLLYIYKIQKLPTSLISLLSHPKVKLVGVNIKNDVWKLTRDFKEFPGKKVVENNCLDCGPYTNSVFSRSGRWSLARLTAYLLKKKISKDPSVRNSKWHVHPLSKAQKLYAATDAYVSLLLHLTIERQEALNQAEEASAALEKDLEALQLLQ